MEHRKFMTLALQEAQKAADEGEVPVGTVIVKDGKVVARAHNRTEEEKNPLCHSEMLAINTALKALGTKTLEGCTVYVTLEPCPMCMGALLHARIQRLVFGAYEERAGAVISKVQLGNIDFFRKPLILGGYMEKECSSILTDFFDNLRKNRE